ncbi:MORN repeat-containing protein 3 [Oopsacas minuta]|uniref:MORN repeat-containing protein 3 n=1 Tax=Oopsacas minuta TaxID=111878 RepID=A0AAV7JHY8_9METZ|nr:MORN repeat-containing protein 3 [Oopsacas minuta]
MPISKQKPTSEPLWKTWDLLSQKEGIRHSVYDINGDKYVGEWKDNQKDGKGSSYSRNGRIIYNGDWKNNLRHGFGTLSIRNENMQLVKEYVGGWKYDKRHGYGTRYYGKNDYYEGEWYADMRSGWGRKFYVDGSVYEGEWLDDKRSGDGILRLANQDR